MTNDENQSKNDSNELFKNLYTSETDEKNKEADLEKLKKI